MRQILVKKILKPIPSITELQNKNDQMENPILQ